MPAPSWISIGIYYAVLIVALSGILKTSLRKTIFAATLILIAAGCFYCWENSRDKAEITILPLNGGHAAVVDAAGTKNDWLIDCGNENAVNFTLKNFLRAQGVNKIPRLVLTEGDSQNVGGAELLGHLFSVGELWTSPVHFRSGNYNKIISQFENGGHPQGSRHKIFNRGDTIGVWLILYPSATNNFPRADDNALVLLGNFGGAKILLLSDLSRAGQSDLLSRTNDLRADVVVAGLPAEGEPLCDALIDAIQPKIIIIADSEFPANRRTSHALKGRLAGRNVPGIYTRESGAVKIVTDKSGWKLQTMDGQKFKSP